MVVEAPGSDAPGAADDPTSDWPLDRWVALLDRIEHRQPDVGLRFWSSPLWLEVTMEGPDADRWPTVSAQTAWDWQSNDPCTEATELAASGADEARILPVVARYTIVNLILNAVHEIGEWLRVDGRQVFPPHTELTARGDGQGNGAVSLQFAFGTDGPRGGALAAPACAGSPVQSPPLPGSALRSFTYLPLTSISYDDVGPMIRRWLEPHALWRSRWSPATCRPITTEAVDREVHRMLVLHEADRICRAFHVDGQQRWRLVTDGQEVEQTPGPSPLAGESLSITVVYAGDSAATGTSISSHTSDQAAVADRARERDARTRPVAYACTLKGQPASMLGLPLLPTGVREDVMSSSPAFDPSAAASPTTPPTPPPPGRRPAPRKRGQLATYGVGRTCAAPSCETTLSRYNDAPLCWHHGELAQAAEHRR